MKKNLIIASAIVLSGVAGLCTIASAATQRTINFAYIGGVTVTQAEVKIAGSPNPNGAPNALTVNFANSPDEVTQHCIAAAQKANGGNYPAFAITGDVVSQTPTEFLLAHITKCGIIE